MMTIRLKAARLRYRVKSRARLTMLRCRHRLTGVCGHKMTTAIHIDEQGHWMRCDVCGLKRGPQGWTP